MASGSLLAMPVLVINMGGEMVYILEQRLLAQQIQEHKAQKVLSDVIRTMYYPRFIEELFKPQDIYSAVSTQQIFDRLAHSSIMRLNESSMEKLFDLMAMGFKYQVITCRSPDEVITVTLNHLNTLKKISQASGALADLVDDCIDKIHKTYDGLTSAEYMSLRHILAAFFQDRKVKVSLFLQDEIQNPDGSLVIQSTGMLPDGFQRPGSVTYFTAGTVVQTDILPVVNSGSWVPADNNSGLGSNLYTKERSPMKIASPTSPANQASNAAVSPASPKPAAAFNPKAAVCELNLLANIIGTKPVTEKDSFQLKLFQDSGDSAEGSGIHTVNISSTNVSHQAGLDSVRKQMEDLDTSPTSNKKPEEDDLLDLLG